MKSYVIIICAIPILSLSYVCAEKFNDENAENNQKKSNPIVSNLTTDSGLFVSVSNVALLFDAKNKTSEPVQQEMADDDTIYIYTSRPVKIVIQQSQGDGRNNPNPPKQID